MSEPNEEQWERLCATARKVIQTTPAGVAAEGVENFLEILEAVYNGLETTTPRVGRGSLMVELGTKRADIRDHPERYRKTDYVKLSGQGRVHDRETSPKPDASPSKELGKVHPQKGLEPPLKKVNGRVLSGAEAAELIQETSSAIKPEPDEDDLPW